MVIVFADRCLKLELEDEMWNLVFEGYRPGTLKNLKTQIRSYYEFCERYSLQELPASDKQLTSFAVFLHKFKHLKPNTICNYLAGVRSLHGIMELQVPESGYLFRAVIKGIKARNKVPTRKARPIDPFIFRAIRPFVNMRDPLELVAWVAALMGFHLLLRASNITSKSRTRFNPAENLTRSDFRMHKGIMMVHIRWTKTMQYQEKKLLIPVIPFVQGDISAVKWFQFMIDRIPAEPNSPAFAVPTKTRKGVILYPLSYSQLSRLLKQWTTAAGIPSSGFTSHCLRRGGACWLKKNKVEDSVIQAIGDWQTQAFLEYIDSALSTRMEAMNAFAGNN